MQDTLSRLGEAIPVAAGTAQAAAQAVGQLLEHPVVLHLLHHPPTPQVPVPPVQLKLALVLGPSSVDLSCALTSFDHPSCAQPLCADLSYVPHVPPMIAVTLLLNPTSSSSVAQLLHVCSPVLSPCLNVMQQPMHLLSQVRV